VEGILSKDMANASEYLQTWTLQLGKLQKKCWQQNCYQKVFNKDFTFVQGESHPKIDKNSTDL